MDFPGPQGLRSRGHRRYRILTTKFTSPALRRRLSVFTPCEPPLYPAFHADHGPPSRSTSLGFRALQHIRIDAPTLRSLSKAPDPRCLASREDPLPGFGYPLSGPMRRPLGISFNPQRSWASPFEAFLRPGDRKLVSQLPLRSRVFVQDLAASYRRPSGFIPPRQPYPFFASRVINPGQGRPAPLGFRPFGFSLRRAEEEVSLFLHPLSLFAAADVSILRSRSPRGFTLDGLAFSLRGGRRPVWPSPPTVARHPLRRSTGRGLFFHLERPEPSRVPSGLS